MQITPVDCARALVSSGLTIGRVVLWIGRAVIWVIASSIKWSIKVLLWMGRYAIDNPFPQKNKLYLLPVQIRLKQPSAHIQTDAQKTAKVENDFKTWLKDTHYKEWHYPIDWTSDDIYMFGMHEQHEHFPANIQEKLAHHGLSKEYDYLSNYDDSPLIIEGELFQSVEHYYQANKFPKESHTYHAIKNAHDADHARRIAHQNGNPRYPGSKAIEIMKRGLWAKFICPDGNPTVNGAKLLQTKGILFEGNKRQRFSDETWGAVFATDWSSLHGKNQLGYMLMEIREQLRAYQGNN